MKTEQIAADSLLVSCGILRKEVRWLVEANHWPVEAHFLDSSLHVDFDRLGRTLTAALTRVHGRPTTVLYGCCHPLMDQLVDAKEVARTAGQNCVEMLLGHDLFTRELGNGAYFLLEDWAVRWSYISAIIFGGDVETMRSIFQGDRKYILGLRTPCSGDFTDAAAAASETVGLPLRWMDVSLRHLESVLRDAFSRARTLK
jgi:hypothetical protein